MDTRRKPARYCPKMIVLFTDFGPAGPYVGQMIAALHRAGAASVPIVELLSDAPAHDPKSSAYLLAALVPDFPPDAVFLAVVDPGVGGPRPPVVLRAGGRWFVGPGNGLFEIAARRAGDAAAWRITLQPDRLSASFHGRDLFAPAAAAIATGKPLPGNPIAPDSCGAPDWPDDLAQIIYIDHFGNAVTGLRAAGLSATDLLEAGGQRIGAARTFSDVAPGAPFWYENANGLAEIAVNRGRAAAFGLAVGAPVSIYAG